MKILTRGLGDKERGDKGTRRGAMGGQGDMETRGGEIGRQGEGRWVLCAVCCVLCNKENYSLLKNLTSNPSPEKGEG